MKDGRHESELLAIIREEIAPHYRLLSSEVKLGLWRVRDTRSYLALQFWTSRGARDAAIVSPAYEDWLRDYQPVLERWHQMMELEDEWESDDLTVDLDA